MKEGQLGRNPIKEQLRELFGEVKQYNEERKQRFDEIDDINRRMQDVIREQDKLKKSIHPDYQDESKLERGVKELERRLTTNDWGRAEEERLIKEIDMVKQSRPFFAKIERTRKEFNDLKEERERVKKSMEPTNKIIRALNEQINKVKLEDNVFNDKKQTKQYALTNIKTKISNVLERQKELKEKRLKAKETFYGQMCDYEIQ